MNNNDHAQMVTIRLKTLTWREAVVVTGGGGVGPDLPTAHPYLWTVFFKVDGETITVTAGSPTLSGQATMVTTKGSHGNLGGMVQVGGAIPIPEALGEWSTTLVPMPTDSTVMALTGNREYPATIGFVAVVMIQGNVTDAAAEAGHQALNASVQAALAQLLATVTIDNQKISDDAIKNVIAQIPKQVSDAIIHAQSGSENFWVWLSQNPDVEIGHAVLRWSQTDLAPPNDNQGIHVELGTDSFWDIDGSVNATDICAVSSTQILVSRRGRTHCTNSVIVAGEPCAFIAVTSAPTATATRTFQFKWNFVGAHISSGGDQQKVIVDVLDDVTEVTAAVTVTDNFGCTINQSQTFTVVTQQTVGLYDRLCELIDQIRGLQSPLAQVLLNPAGPDPGPERALAELNNLAERLVLTTSELMRNRLGFRGLE